jgi:hypothetical protein
VGLSIRPVDADRDEWVLTGLYFLSQLGRAQDSVRFYGKAQIFPSHNAEQFPYVRVQEGLTTGQLHAGKAKKFRLPNYRLKELHRECRVALPSPLELRRYPAVATGEVAALGEVEVDAVETVGRITSFEDRELRSLKDRFA